MENAVVSDEEILQFALIGYKIRKRTIQQEITNLRSLLGAPAAKRVYHMTAAGRRAIRRGIRKYWSRKRLGR